MKTSAFSVLGWGYFSVAGADVDFKAVVPPGGQQYRRSGKDGGDDFSNTAISDADDEPDKTSCEHEAARDDVAFMKGDAGGIDSACQNDQPSDRVFWRQKNCKECDDNKKRQRRCAFCIEGKERRLKRYVKWTHCTQRRWAMLPKECNVRSTRRL